MEMNCRKINLKNDMLLFRQTAKKEGYLSKGGAYFTFAYVGRYILPGVIFPDYRIN
jgi:hypothetical protein